MAGPLIPRATYRLQLHAGFGFADATAIVPYLAELGISHLYASPILKACPGSTHGYDVIDPSALNPELGSEQDFEALGAALRGHDMALLLDIVPNHMGVLEADNPWWLDVLENGPAARHAAAFDIEWNPPQHELRGKVLLPVLGQPYGQALEAGELRPLFEAQGGQFVVHYFEHRFPIDPSDYPQLLRLVPPPADASAAEHAQLDSLVDGFARLPPRDALDAAARATRQREVGALKQSLAQWHAEVAWAPGWLQAIAAELHGQVGRPESFDGLDTLLQRQAWRLAHWRAAGDELNYRRFFDINALAGLRIEDETVFEAAHRRVFAWVADRRVAGLRIDHPDGMADPAAYFERLQRRCAELLGSDAGDTRAIYLVAEKILAEDEPWPRDWPVHGDTGYRFANQANAVFVDAEQVAAFDALTREFIDTTVDFDAELQAAKRSIVSVSLAADLRLLTELAHDIALMHRHTRDFTREGLQSAIVEFSIAFDVYRTYVSPRGAGPLDLARIEKCAALARARCRPSLASHVDFVRRLMLQEPALGAPAAACRLRFVQRLQQFTAPVMAKAMEDTAFYRYHRLASLNDVGGDPRRFGLPVADFHAANATRLREMPHTMLASSTHDSKRSEDVRTRLDVLSEMPVHWLESLYRWRELAQLQLRMGGGSERLQPNDELLLYQTLVGIWPAEPVDESALDGLRQRVGAYMLKAVREAKQRSSWLDGDDAYEAAVQHCVALLLARLEPNPFLSELRRFVAEIAPFGCCNSLGLLALKLTSPGVPDFYQGNEDWTQALVDPDNRRPVDFAELQARLQSLGEPAVTGPQLGLSLAGGLHKLWLTRQLLRWRTEAAALFREGDYRPLIAEGPQAAAVLAFARCSALSCSVTVVTRLPWRCSDGELQRLLDGSCWDATRLPLPQWPDAAAVPRAWLDVVSGRLLHALPAIDSPAPALPLHEVLRGLPVAVLRPLIAA